MTINARAKGIGGEQEVCKWLNELTESVLLTLGKDCGQNPHFTRNQNQSAIGGDDICNGFGLCIEVKRQQVLQKGLWWAQCLRSAERFGGFPVVLYRQNGNRKWNAMLRLEAVIGDKRYPVQAEIDHTTFERFFVTWIRNRVESKEE
jgi:hypothetical protein